MMSSKVLFGLVFLVSGLTTSAFLTTINKNVKGAAFVGLDYILDEFVKGNDNEEILKKIDQRFVQLDTRLRSIEDSLQEVKDLQTIRRAQEVEYELKEHLYRYRDIARKMEENWKGNSTTTFNMTANQKELHDEIEIFKDEVSNIPSLLRHLHFYIADDSIVSSGRALSLIRGYIDHVLKMLESAVDTYNVTLTVNAIENYHLSLTQFQYDCFALYNSTCFGSSLGCYEHFADLQERLTIQSNVFEAHTPSVLIHLKSTRNLENISITHPDDHTVLYSQQTVSIVKDGGVDWDEIGPPAKAGLRCSDGNDQWNLVQHPSKPGYLLQSDTGCYLASDRVFLNYKNEFPLFWFKGAKIDKKDFLLCQTDLDENVATFLVTADASSKETLYTFKEGSTRKYLNVKVTETEFLQAIDRRLTMVTFLNSEKDNSWKIEINPSPNSSCDTSSETDGKSTHDIGMSLTIGLIVTGVIIVSVTIIWRVLKWRRKKKASRSPPPYDDVVSWFEISCKP